jgi:5-methylcytosine-specific restriction endonuclease McrA
MDCKNKYDNIKTFYDWCVENNRMDLNDLFDEDLNKCSTKDVRHRSNLKWWFKCPRGIHASEKYFMCAITRRADKILNCKKCSSLAQIVIDRFGEDYLWNHWHPDNLISPWEISASNCNKDIKIKIKCHNKDYHIYEQVPASFAKGIGCPYCINRQVHPLDSLGAIFPEIIERWSDKNDKTPYEFAPHSEKQVWLTCPNGKHDDYLQRIHNAVNYNFTCRQCENERAGLQKRGANNHLWRGGINRQNDILRKRFEYKTWRTKVYQRDGYTCQCCGKQGKLNAHHLYSFASYEELRYDVNNGITLCIDCHDSTKKGSFHNTCGTHDNTPDQLREYILRKSGQDIYVTHPEILSLTQQSN